jgi:putative transposase
MIIKAFKYRLYPTRDQQVLINKHIGACRTIYNLALETKQESYKKGTKLSAFDLINQLPDLKIDHSWLKEINSQSLQQSIKNVDAAYNRFFKGTSKFPKYKSKARSRQSFNIPQAVSIKNGKLVIPKFKRGIKFIQDRTFKGTIKQATISKTPTNKYFVSILVETTDSPLVKKSITRDNTIGIDLGIKEFLITSEGLKIRNPKFLKEKLGKLKYVQSRYSRFRGKKNKLKLQKLHEKVRLQRKDFQHKLSSDIIKNHDTIALETLKVPNMLKNHCLAQAIADAAWSQFTTMLEYKANWYGKNIIRIGTFEPSSKLCSCCGHKKEDLVLADRNWTCSNCNTTHDRDINAAKNIKDIALKGLKHLCMEDTRKIVTNCLQ